MEWARRHLGLEREFVVARAKELEPDQELRRSPAQLQALWRDLVARASDAVPAGEVDAPPEAEAPPEPDGPPEAEAPPELDRPPEPDGPPEAGGPSEAGAPPELDAPPEEEAVDGFDLADLDDLADAPSHAHDIEEKIKATFPGTELTLLPEPGGDT